MNTETHIWAINETKNSMWSGNRFHEFKKYATRDEFLTSQVPFFYAVQAFPRMLCILGSKIEDSETRMLVVENIFEEHGQGNTQNYHTQSYKTYLKALGGEGNLYKNPWVTMWIDKVLNLNCSSRQYAAYLAGIEYLYALICEDVAKYVDEFPLECKQSHYSKHAELDWEHGQELLDVSLMLDGSESDLKSYFLQGQSDFLHMYGSLFIPTISEMIEFNKEKISFYYSRESSLIENKILNDVETDSAKVLMICSGGEHLFEMLSHENPTEFDMIDINCHQIELAQEKLKYILGESLDSSTLSEQHVGKFEKMFSLLRSYFSDEEKQLLVHQDTKTQEKLHFIVNILFSNKYLNSVFGEAATQYTVKSFSEHFYNIFVNKLHELEDNSRNVFFGSSMRNYEKLKARALNHHQINWMVCNPKDLKKNYHYNVIDISNIGDWMSQQEFADVIENMKALMSPQSKLIVRKLLGDYSLESVLGSHGLKTVKENDRTGFYSEVVVASLLN